MAAVELRPGQRVGSDQSLEPWQVDALNQDLDKAKVKQRSKGGTSLSYIEGHEAIRVANAVFGLCGWTRKTQEMRCVADTAFSKNGRDGFLVAYVGHCTVRVWSPTMQEWVESDGWGYGEGIDYQNVGQAHESAIKEAETDAMKRALVKFGDQFGLALYDKAQAHVADDDPKPAPKRAAATVKREQVTETVAQGKPKPGPLPAEQPDTRSTVPKPVLDALKAAMVAGGVSGDEYKKLRKFHEQPPGALTVDVVPSLLNLIVGQSVEQAMIALRVVRAAGVEINERALSSELVQPPAGGDEQ
jgi:DNA recombination protein Rad52